MELEFWHQRWENNEIGFHQGTVNQYLAYFYDTQGPALTDRSGLKVFVPLCGKTADMYWLSTKGYSVVGVECSDIAVRAFFDEQNLKHEVHNTATHARYASDSIEIYQGDFFTLSTEATDDVTDVYDRASLVALPPEMRKQYASRMAELLRPGTRMLLIAFTYPQEQMDGPPFSVTEEEVHELFDADFEVDKLLVRDILDDEPRFKAQGLTMLKETAYKLKRR